MVRNPLQLFSKMITQLCDIIVAPSSLSDCSYDSDCQFDFTPRQPPLKPADCSLDCIEELLLTDKMQPFSSKSLVSGHDVPEIPFLLGPSPMDVQGSQSDLRKRSYLTHVQVFSKNMHTFRRTLQCAEPTAKKRRRMC